MSSKSEKRVIVNLGCGTTRIPGSIGVDIVAIPDYVDIVHDVEEIPYPFKKNSVDEIHMYHVLEHLTAPVKKMEELHRILKPGGVIYIRVPHFSSLAAFTDMTHIRPFAYLSFDIFQPTHPQHYDTSATFEIVKKEIKYFGLYPNSGVYAEYIHPNQCFILMKPVVRVINFLISLSPVVFERFWCFWVGGAGELVVTLRKT
jgi:predicted SAM-dependent methyltransferase